MNVVTHTIPVKVGKKITLIPIEPHIQWTDRNNSFNVKKWNKMIKRVLGDKHTFLFFAGDITDDDRPSTRARKAAIFSGEDRSQSLSASNMADRLAISKFILPLLMPVKERILGAIDGDHFQLYRDGTTSTQYIFKELGIPNVYIGRRMGWIRLLFLDSKKTLEYRILMRHGRGGTGKIGSDINKLITSNMQFEADLFIGGHTHKKWCYSEPTMYLSGNKIKTKTRMYCRAGSLFNSYGDGLYTYAEDAEYPPLSTGFPRIEITLGRPRVNQGNLIITEYEGVI